MLDFFGISFIDVLELIGTIATVVALVYAVKSFQKNTRINEAVFIKDLFESFQRDRQVILDNPQVLEVLAKERGTTPQEIIKSSIGSFDINRAYSIFYLYENKLIPVQRWEQDIRDMRLLFSDTLVRKKWEAIGSMYPESFQSFVTKHLLSSST